MFDCRAATLLSPAKECDSESYRPRRPQAEGVNKTHGVAVVAGGARLRTPAFGFACLSLVPVAGHPEEYLLQRRVLLQLRQRARDLFERAMDADPRVLP